MNVTEALYERYKDALRRGHIAALRGRLEIAAVAYDEASRIAPDRALPHASLGDVLRRLDRLDEALAAFGAALERAPSDEASLAARSEVLARLGRRAHAAADLDALAEIQDAAGRLDEACDSARRALELAESRSRRRLVEGLTRRLRESAPQDAVAAAALERAAAVLEARGTLRAERRPAVHQDAGSDVAPGAEPAAERAHPDDAGPPPEAAPPGVSEGTTMAEATEAAAAPDTTAPDAAPDAAAPDASPPAPEEPPDRGAELTTEAEVLIAAGNRDAALERSLEAMASHRAAGRLAAAIDACYLALAVAPDATDLHLALAELYLDQGWREPAGEKLLLLGRLVGLDGDDAARDRLCHLVRRRFADDGRLMELCA